MNRRSVATRLVAVLALGFLSVGCVPQAHGATCTAKAKVTGFATVKPAGGGKVYLYEKPKACEAGSDCATKRKTFLDAATFVQTGRVEGAFVCAVFRDFRGRGGELNAGWMRKCDSPPFAVA